MDCKHERKRRTEQQQQAETFCVRFCLHCPSTPLSVHFRSHQGSKPDRRSWGRGKTECCCWADNKKIKRERGGCQESETFCVRFCLHCPSTPLSVHFRSHQGSKPDRRAWGRGKTECCCWADNKKIKRERGGCQECETFCVRFCLHCPSTPLSVHFRSHQGSKPDRRAWGRGKTECCCWADNKKIKRERGGCQESETFCVRFCLHCPSTPLSVHFRSHQGSKPDRRAWGRGKTLLQSLLKSFQNSASCMNIKLKISQYKCRPRSTGLYSVRIKVQRSQMSYLRFYEP
ncbi:zinc finger protein 334-like [Bufo gargarizans]|uniref:zinc finger protein 334-like n=1 Tax=Bufo gargarizans TaxID=30331 RepID=UPI001CF0EE65|nr:zinc finger protein 334-like [Bufo gargarizans]